MVTFRVSNVGPRLVDFEVFWFECRAKRDGSLLATNRLKSVTTPLWPGKSTNLTTAILLAGVPVEDCLCCYQVYWFQREAPARHIVDSLGQWWYDLFGATWHPIWQSEHLTNVTAFAANIEVADYFRRMYGFTRTQWLEDLARMESARTQATGPPRYGLRMGYTPQPTRGLPTTPGKPLLTFAKHQPPRRGMPDPSLHRMRRRRIAELSVR